MPVMLGQNDKGCYAKWGQNGKEYFYECGNEDDRKRAKMKAHQQGAAIGEYSLTAVDKFDIMELYLKWISMPSSNIYAIEYNEQESILKVEFVSGSVYQYTQVPIEVYETMMSMVNTGESIGSWFYYNVRMDYKYKKLYE